MFPNIIEHQLFMLKIAEAELTDVSGSAPLSLIDTGGECIGASTRRTVCLYRTGLHQGFQRTLGLRWFALDVNRQFVCGYPFQSTPRPERSTTPIRFIASAKARLRGRGSVVNKFVNVTPSISPPGLLIVSPSSSMRTCAAPRRW